MRPDGAVDRVFVTRGLPGGALDRLASHVDLECWPGDMPPSPGELAELASSADGLLTMLTDRVDAELLDACPRVRVVSNMAVGVDNIDLPELTRRSIPVGNTPGVLTDATADLAFALLLAAARRITESRDFLLAGRWATWQPGAFLGLELRGSTLGIVGLGAIGRAMASRAAGFGMNVIGWSRTPRSLPDVRFAELAELFATSDVISLHVALSAETRHLIGASELSAMKPGAILVNTARGAIVDQVALFDSLSSGHLGAAALDVFESEPIPLSDPLLRLPNFVAVPHIGSATVTTRSAMAELAVDNVLAGLKGERLAHCANPAVYEGA